MADQPTRPVVVAECSSVRVVRSYNLYLGRSVYAIERANGKDALGSIRWIAPKSEPEWREAAQSIAEMLGSAYDVIQKQS